MKVPCRSEFTNGLQDRPLPARLHEFVNGKDHLAFVGYGTPAQGASVTQADATHWQVNSAGNLTHETIAFSNAAALHAADWHLS